MSNMKLYMVSFDVDPFDAEEIDLGLIVWAYTSRLAVVAWRQWAENILQDFGLDRDEAIGLIESGPEGVHLIPSTPPDVDGAAVVVYWGTTTMNSPGAPCTETIPPEEWT